MRVTALVPSYNAAAFLPAAIASIRAQTRPVDEILVVDDASSDDSAAVAEAEGARVLRLERNAGPSEARNRGIAAATGDVIAFLDADDLWLPPHCERVAGALERYPEAVLASSRVRVFGAEDLESVSPPVTPDQPFDALPLLLRRNIVYQTAAAVRREALLAAGGYDTALRYSEDYDLWMRTARQGPFVHVAEVTARYRRHAGQATAGAQRGPIQLVECSWRLRLREERALAGDPAHSAADVHAWLRDALDNDFREAWHAGQHDVFARLLEIGAGAPWLAPVTRRWRLRARLGWRAWQAARRLKRAALRQPAA